MSARIRLLACFMIVLSGGVIVSSATAAPGRPAIDSADATLAVMRAINARLQGGGAPYTVEAIEFFTIGESRPDVRIHQQPFRWVPNDERRLATGEDLTYLIDYSDGATTSGLTADDTAAAIRSANATWAAERCLGKVPFYELGDPGDDPDIFDSFFGFGTAGFPFYADIVNAGWLPRDYFEAVGGPGGGRGILAFSVTFIFTDDAGIPTDINGDNYLDTALNEVYFNDTFGDPNNDRAESPWAIGQPLPAIDVQTVGLHENGHSLGIGHFGPPPAAIMNPIYAGIQLAPLPSDNSGMCANYRSWPNP